MKVILIVLVCLALICSVIAAASAGITVVANVRGKKYTIVAETVEEFTEKAEAMAELEAGQQSVLFRGKVLSPEDRLEDIGVQENGRRTKFIHPHPPHPQKIIDQIPNPFAKQMY